MKYIIDCSKQESLLVDDLYSTELEVINVDKSILIDLDLNRFCKISDLTPLIEITTLQKLRIGNNNKVKDLSYLKNLPNLKYLVLVNLPKITNLDWLESVPKFTVRNIVMDEVNFKPLPNLKVG